MFLCIKILTRHEVMITEGFVFLMISATACVEDLALSYFIISLEGAMRQRLKH
jgi:hypothetical protein